MKYDALTKKEVQSVINRRPNTSRIPVMLHFWTHADTYQGLEPDVQNILSQYPEDIQIVEIRVPNVYSAPADDPDYRWVNIDNPYPDIPFVDFLGLDGKTPLKDWNQLDSIIERFPKASYPSAIPQNFVFDGRYSLGHWWYGLFEMHWRLRGTSNALMDYYTNPEEVHRLFSAITNLYIGYIQRSKEELNLDGIWTSDDLGHQTGPFFSNKIFDTFFLPYYTKMVGTTRKLGMDHWLHACGCIENFIPQFIKVGINMIHPIQKYTMDEKIIAQRFGSKVNFYAGIDVQKITVSGKPEDVRQEVRFIMDNFWRHDGGLIFGAGNGINYDTPIENLEALFDEAYSYGSQKVN